MTSELIGRMVTLAVLSVAVLVAIGSGPHALRSDQRKSARPSRAHRIRAYVHGRAHHG